MYTDCSWLTSFPNHMNPLGIKSEKPTHVENSIFPDVWSESPPSSPSSSTTSGEIRPKIASKSLESPVVGSKPKLTPLYLFPASSLASDLISSSRAINRATTMACPSNYYTGFEENINSAASICKYADFDISNLDILPSCLNDLNASWESPIHDQTMTSLDRRRSMDATTSLSTGVWNGFKSPEFVHMQDANMDNTLLLTCSYTPSSNMEQVGSASIIEATTTQDNRNLSSLKCPYVGCKKLFTSTHSLRVHLRLHDPERPYHCDQCGKYFDRIHDLQRHSLTHLPVKGFPCSTCGRGFSRSDAVKRHARKCSGKAKSDKVKGKRMKPESKWPAHF